MTGEEAIAILKKGTLFCPTLENRYYLEAFDMAIKALEQCEDCISREDAIKNVAQIAKAAAKSDKQKSLCGRIIFMLEHMSEVSE